MSAEPLWKKHFSIMHHPAIHMHDGTKILRTIISNIRDIRQLEVSKKH